MRQCGVSELGVGRSLSETLTLVISRQRLRPTHALLAIIWVAVGYALIPFWGANLFAIGSACGCLVAGLGRATVSEMFITMAFTFFFIWYVFNAVEGAKARPILARQRTRPSSTVPDTTGVFVTPAGRPADLDVRWRRSVPVVDLPREVRIPWVASWLAVAFFFVHLVLAICWPVPQGRRSAALVFGALFAAEVGTGVVGAGVGSLVLATRLVRSPAHAARPISKPACWLVPSSGGSRSYG